jgi:VWFA-related protein
MRRVALALALLLAPRLLAPRLLAQEPPPPPVFHGGAELVIVDVVVTDKDGRLVRGLTKDDFVVYEDGAAQAIETFEAVDLPADPAAAGVGARPATVSSNSVASTPRATLVVAFDELHMAPATTEEVRRRLDTVWREGSLGPADVLLLSTAGGGSWLGRLPEDAGGMQRALDRFRGARFDRPGYMTDYEAFLIAARNDDNVLTQVYRRYVDQGYMPDPSLVLPDPGKRMRGVQTDAAQGQPAIGKGAVEVEAEEKWRTARNRQAATLASLVQLLHGLAARPGRKAVIMVSEGFIHDPAVLEHRELVEAARRARAAVHVVDPRNRGVLGHDTGDYLRDIDTRDILQAQMSAKRDAEGSDALAHATGGRIVRSLQALPQALSRIGNELRTYYLLGYAPPSARADGRYHELKVAARRADLELEARPGYFAVADPEIRSARHTSARPRLEAALASPFDDSSLPLQLASYVLGRGPRGGSVVRLVAEVDTTGMSAPDTLDAVFVLTSRGSSRAQQAAQAAPVATGGNRVRLEQHFEADAGTYQARLVVRARAGDRRLGSVRHALEVQPPDAFRITTPILTDVLQAQRPLARAERRFQAGATLHCVVQVMGAPGAAVKAGVVLRDASGQTLLRIPDSPIAAVPPSRQWSIPLGSLPAGRYELEISVQADGKPERLEAREPFEVLEAPAAGPTA